MTHRVELLEDAKADIEELPTRALQLAALRVAVLLRDDPFQGEPLRNRHRVGDLGACRRVTFDEQGWTDKPRYRLVYRNDPHDGSIAVVLVIAVGSRERLAAYRTAAARLRGEARRRLLE